MISRIVCLFRGHQWGPRPLNVLGALFGAVLGKYGMAYDHGEECQRCGKDRPKLESPTTSDER